MYSLISDYVTKKKTDHEAACKILERIAIAEKKKFMRTKKNQNFYEKLAESHRRVFNINLDNTIENMINFFDLNHPPSSIKTTFFSRNISFEAEKIKKELDSFKTKNLNSHEKWALIKNVLRTSYQCSRMFKFSSREKEFFSKINTFLVFKEPRNMNKKNSTPIMDKRKRVKEDFEADEASRHIEKAMKRKRSGKKLSNDQIIVVGDDKKPLSSIKM
jgi:hypothetical protein